MSPWTLKAVLGKDEKFVAPDLSLGHVSEYLTEAKGEDGADDQKQALLIEPRGGVGEGAVGVHIPYIEP